MENKKQNSVGRPEKPIDWKLVETMIHARCTEKSICHKLQIHRETFIHRFREKYGEDFTTYSTKHHCVGVENVLLAQYIKALKGNPQLLIHLGKEWCGQGASTDKTTTAPNEEYLRLLDEHIKLKYELEQLKNAIQPQTTSVLQRSDSAI